MASAPSWSCFGSPGRWVGSTTTSIIARPPRFAAPISTSTPSTPRWLVTSSTSLCSISSFPLHPEGFFRESSPAHQQVREEALHLAGFHAILGDRSALIRDVLWAMPIHLLVAITLIAYYMDHGSCLHGCQGGSPRRLVSATNGMKFCSPFAPAIWCQANKCQFSNAAQQLQASCILSFRMKS